MLTESPRYSAKNVANCSHLPHRGFMLLPSTERTSASVYGFAWIFSIGLETGCFTYFRPIVLTLHTDGALCRPEFPRDACGIRIGLHVQFVDLAFSLGEPGLIDPSL